MAITFSELTQLGTTTGASSYTTASVTLTAGRLYLVGVQTDKVTGAVASAVATTGGAITFAKYFDSGTYTTNFNTSVWWVVAGSTVTDTIVITATSSVGCNYSVVEATGAATITPLVQSTGSVKTMTTSNTWALVSNITAGNARYTFCGHARTDGSLAATTGTWTNGTLVSHTANGCTTKAAWNGTPATTDKTVTWTADGSANGGAVIVEIAVAGGAGASVDFMGAIPI